MAYWENLPASNWFGGDTIVFFSGDNGPHEEGVPLPNSSTVMVRYMASSEICMMAASGANDRAVGLGKLRQVNDQPFALWDFLPTATEQQEFRHLRGIDGISLSRHSWAALQNHNFL